MRCSISSRKLYSELRALSSLVSSRLAFSPLLRLSVSPEKESGLALYINNGERWAECLISDAEVVAPGTVGVGTRDLLGILAALGNDCSLTLSAKSAGLDIETPTARIELATTDLENQPAPFALGDAATEYELPAAVFTTLGRLTGYARARQWGRYAIHATQWELSPQGVTWATTDGVRVAVADYRYQEDFSGIRPERAFKALVDFGQNGAFWADRGLSADSLVQVSVGGQSVACRAGRRRAGFLCIESSFPPIEQVIQPREAARARLFIDRSALIEALNVGVVADSNMVLRPSTDVLEIAVVSPAPGPVRAATICVPSMFDAAPAGNVEALIRPRLLREALDALSVDQVEIGLYGTNRPIQLWAREGPVDLLYVQAPILEN